MVAHGLMSPALAVYQSLRCLVYHNFVRSKKPVLVPNTVVEFASMHSRVKRVRQSFPPVGQLGSIFHAVFSRLGCWGQYTDGVTGHISGKCRRLVQLARCTSFWTCCSRNKLVLFPLCPSHSGCCSWRCRSWLPFCRPSSRDGGVLVAY